MEPGKSGNEDEMMQLMSVFVRLTKVNFPIDSNNCVVVLDLSERADSLPPVHQ